MPSPVSPSWIASGALGAFLWAGAAAAQDLDVPVPWIPDGQAAGCAGWIVAGLDPNGDNFLAVRSGPGTQFAKIDELRTGDTVRSCAAQGDWYGVYYPGEGGRSGWVHRRYLVEGAG
jgi:hypothetical protein